MIATRHGWWQNGYSQTYDNDYDEIFAPVTKMSTVRTLVSLTVNGGLEATPTGCEKCIPSRDLLEEVYMEISELCHDPNIIVQVETVS